MKPLFLFVLPLLVACGAQNTSEASSVPAPSQPSTSEASSSEASSESAITSEEISSASSLASSSPVHQPVDPYKEPFLGRQYYLNHIGDIYSAWQEYAGRGVTIAVIDKGFNPNHEDFLKADGTSKVRNDSACFYVSGASVVTSVGKDYVINMGDSHGTFCAGVAAAAINGKGVVGVAPEAELLLLKTDGKPKSIVEAFRYAADHGAKVVTISIGSYDNYVGDLESDGSDLTTVFDEAVSYCKGKGTVVVSAAGNGGLDGNPTRFTYPGASAGVIGVGGLAANSSNEIWEGSSYNASPTKEFIDVLAPADGMFGCCHYDDKKYDEGWNGTSFASPIVAGMAALYFEKFPDKSPADFESSLYASSHEIATSSRASKSQLGHGRVDVGKLLGVSAKGKQTLRAQDNVDNLYAYVWNSVTGASMQNWPGKAMSKSGSTFSVEIDFDQYDSLVITESSSGPQTVDVFASSLLYGGVYDLRSATYEANANAYSGVYAGA